MAGVGELVELKLAAMEKMSSVDIEPSKYINYNSYLGLTKVVANYAAERVELTLIHAKDERVFYTEGLLAQRRP